MEQNLIPGSLYYTHKCSHSSEFRWRYWFMPSSSMWDLDAEIATVPTTTHWLKKKSYNSTKRGRECATEQGTWPSLYYVYDKVCAWVATDLRRSLTGCRPLGEPTAPRWLCKHPDSRSQEEETDIRVFGPKTQDLGLIGEIETFVSVCLLKEDNGKQENRTFESTEKNARADGSTPKWSRLIACSSRVGKRRRFGMVMGVSHSLEEGSPSWFRIRNLKKLLLWSVIWLNDWVLIMGVDSAWWFRY